jgi:hypothetical protein
MPIHLRCRKESLEDGLAQIQFDDNPERGHCQGRHPNYAEEKPDNPNDQQKYSQRVLLIVRHTANVLTPLVALKGNLQR